MGNSVYVIMFYGIIDDIIDFWGTEIQSEYGFFTDRAEAESFCKKLNETNDFIHTTDEVNDDDYETEQYFYVSEITKAQKEVA